MKVPVLNFITISCLLIVPFVLKANNPPTTKWTSKDLFEQKVFIENKGQCQLQGKVASKDILFGARQDGLDYFFTATGIWIERYVPVKRTDEELKELSLPVVGKDVKAFEYKYVLEFHQINFIGANPLAVLSGNNAVKQYYNYKINGTVNVKAHAYTKITYTNLYPGIDMEFYFPKNKQGFEYDFIIHSGADISQIKMQYPLAKKVQLSPDGNIAIQSIYGEFTDHAPIANQRGALKPIACSFNLQNGVVQFKTGNYNRNENLIIDPWTATPVFPKSVSDRAYDIDWDDAGNCYAYGGSGQYSEFPLYMLKYDNAGNLLWETQIDDYYTQDFGTELYGDFVVDKKTQSVFVAQGVNIVYGARIIKLDQSGAQVDSSAGNTSMDAIFRIAYSSQYNELVGVGGSYPNYPAPTAMYIDTNLTTQNVVYVNNPPNPYHYMWGVALDNTGNCYMAISGHFTVDTAENDMFKVPMPTLSPTTWEVNDGYTVQGIIDPQYLAHNNGNGFNGMTVSDTNLYTYDSYTLKKWSSVSGKLIDTVTVTPTTAQYIYWSGLTSDSCGNIFVGCHDTVKIYNSSLALVSYFLAPDSIYDLSLGNNNILYACGADFVSAYQLTPHVVDSATTDTFICMGNSIPLQVASAISYSWSPTYGLNTYTGDSVIASPSVTTTYTVICSGSLSCPAVASDTFRFVIQVDTLTLPIIKVAPTNSTICFGKSVLLTATGVKTYQWTPIQGLNKNSGDSVIATPSISTTYIVKGIDTNGCYDIGLSVITVDTLPQVSVFPTSSYICAGQNDTLFASGQPAYQWSPATGLNTTTGDTVIASPNASILYLVTVIGNDGCTNSAASSVNVLPKPIVATTPPSPSVCPGDSILLAFSGARRYKWSPSTNMDSIATDTVIASPAVSTTYTIIGTNIYGCSDTEQTAVYVGLPRLTLSPPAPSFCYGQSILLKISGAATYLWSPSTGLNSSTGDSIIANPTVTTTYSIIGVNGCSDTVAAVVTVDSLPIVIITPPSSSTCQGQSVSLSASGASSYQWSPTTGLNVSSSNTVIATPLTSTTYTIIGTDGNGCKDTISTDITVVIPPNVPKITLSGDTLISSSRQGDQWYRNDSLIKGATDSIYIAKIAGWYKVTVLDAANGCSSSSDSVYYSPTGINQLSSISSQITIYPNPFSTEIVIKINSSVGDLQGWILQITDVLGRVIYTNASLNYSNSIDLSDKSSGVYFITIASKTARTVFPVVRQE